MNQVGELIQQSIEELEYGAPEKAFALACTALRATLEKSSEFAVHGGDYQDFVRRNWRLLVFMGLPRALPMPLEIDYKLKTLVHGFKISGAEEMILHLIRQTAQMERTPVQFKFHAGAALETRGSQIFVPRSLITGLVAIVIFQAANRDQNVPDQFWINIADFKMFISEFWGRMDLAERILDLHDK